MNLRVEKVNMGDGFGHNRYQYGNILPERKESANTGIQIIRKHTGQQFKCKLVRWEAKMLLYIMQPLYINEN